MEQQGTLIPEAPEQVAEPTRQTARLTFNSRQVELPVVTGTEKEKAVDVGRLREKTGLVTLDPGYGNTGACLSAITFLDGERGVLRYRGIPIEQLAQAATYLETAYLLIYGSLPTAGQLQRFHDDVAARFDLPRGMERFFDCFPDRAHPMAILSSMAQALSGYYPELTQPNPAPEQIEEVVQTLLAQVPTIAAVNFRRAQGQPAVPPRKELSYVANLFAMMFGLPAGRSQPDAVGVQALRQILILHADHEQNCSTSTVRLVGSSRASAFTAVSAGLGALWGPLHGGANQAVIEMLEGIHRSGVSPEGVVARAKQKNSGFRLMGFGHRVYKSFDPRSRILKSACDRVLAQLGVQDSLLDLAKRLEEMALKDDYFISRRLYPNVDFYSGIILRALGIPTEQFTVIFALGRLAGWLAHWREMLLSPDFRIGRPRQIYTGPTERPYIPLSQRGS